MPTGQVGQYQIGSFASPVNGGPLDATVVRGNDNAIVGVHDNHDDDPTIHVQSFVSGSLPSASTLGRFIIASDTQRAYFDTGSVLAELAYLAKTGGTVSGPLVLGNNLTFTVAVSQVVPGATSFAVRNNANSVNNLLITDAGVGTFRGSVSVLGDTLKYLSGTATDLTLGNDNALGRVLLRTNGTTRFTIDQSGVTTMNGGSLAFGAGANVTGTVPFTGNVSVGGTFGVTGQATLNATQFSGAAGSVVFGSQVLGSALIPSATATYDIGSNSLRWNSLFLAAGLVAGGQINTTGSLVAGTTLTVSGLSTLNKIKGGGSAPSVAAGANAGTGASVAIVGTDTAGQVTVTAGTGAASGAYAVVTFNAAYATAPYVMLTGVAINQVVWVSGIGTTGFTINIGAAITSGLSALVQYQVIA